MLHSMKSSFISMFILYKHLEIDATRHKDIKDSTYCTSTTTNTIYTRYKFYMCTLILCRSSSIFCDEA